ncbi:ferredoxin [Candidatus Poriferisocius sp.]|uniref:ferredoxin n=1 Tax=Candidatus Poriferisocius sp. TaxID=3101276 RepID=UPI003B0173CD
MEDDRETQKHSGGTLRLFVDHDKCQGHGRCYISAPALFDADEEGFAIVRPGGVDGPLEAAAQSAVLNCPQAAIRLEGEDSA